MCALFLLMALGYFMYKKQLLTDDLISGLTSILVQVLLPALIFNSLQIEFSPALLRGFAIVFGLAFIMMLLTTALAQLGIHLFKVPKRIQGDWMFGSIISNGGFIGLPTVAVLFGSTESFIYATAVVIAINLVLSSAGDSIICHWGPAADKPPLSPISVLRVPSVIAFALGMLCFCLNFQVPDMIQMPLSMLANMTAPLAMLTVGAMLTHCPFHQLFTDKYVYCISLMRLLLIPAIMWAGMRFFIHDPEMLSVATIMMGMPAAAIGAGMALKNGGDPVWASKYTLLSSLLSIVTIPIIRVLSLL